jgi:N-acetylglucosamine malate deacetylase 1
MTRTAFAIGAHPDDIEFMMAGTLILLRQTGYRIHYMNVADGCCGSAALTRAQTVRTRRAEARHAARLIGAVHHASLVPDIEVFYEMRTLARLAAVIREVRPEILLVPSPEDYMEDHTNTGRLAVTAAFCRGMRNFPTLPRRRAVADPCTVYHALPYGLRDGLRRRVWAGEYVDIASVLPLKREMLACHRSQKEWLDHSQGLNAYLKTMEEMSHEVGRMSRRFRCAEGWRRHNPLGFCAPNADPLKAALSRKVWVDPRYERRLNAKP